MCVVSEQKRDGGAEIKRFYRCRWCVSACVCALQDAAGVKLGGRVRTGGEGKKGSGLRMC